MGGEKRTSAQEGGTVNSSGVGRGAEKSESLGPGKNATKAKENKAGGNTRGPFIRFWTGKRIRRKGLKEKTAMCAVKKEEKEATKENEQTNNRKRKKEYPPKPLQKRKPEDVL